MKWILDDTYLEKTKGKTQETKGGDSHSLPWWFAFNRLRPTFKVLLWQRAAMFGVSERWAKEGYRLGFVVDGHAYVGNEVLHDRDGVIYLDDQRWQIFAIDLSGEVIPDEANKKTQGEKEFWVDPDVLSAMDRYLDGRPIVD